jgi:hypothetical protein
MTIPSWLTAIVAGVMIAVAAYCVLRLVSAWRWRRPTELDSDGVHAVMGVAMAGMLAGALRVLPAGIWEVVFAGAVAWFGWQMMAARRGAPASPWRCAHPLPHLVESGAMVYMLAVLHGPARPGPASPAAMGAMAGMAVPRSFSVLALALALFTFGYVMWLGDRLTLAGAGGAGGAGVRGGASAPGCGAALAPRTASCGKMAMGVTMGFMLITML